MVAKVPNLTFWCLHISHFFLFVICIVILYNIVIFICVILWYFAIFYIVIFSPMMRGKLCRAVFVIWVSQNGFVEEIIVRSWNPYYESKWFKCCGLQEYDFFWFTSWSGKTRMPSEGNIWKQSDKQHHLWQQRSSELSTKLHIDRCYDNMQICVWNLIYRLWRYGDRCSSCSGCSSRPWISM